MGPSEDQAEMGHAGGALGPVESGDLIKYSQCVTHLPSTVSVLESSWLRSHREMQMPRESSCAEVHTHTRCTGIAHVGRWVCRVHAISK